MEIGNKILELRKKNNITQEELAEKIGVARQTISKWELGETSPDLKQAALLSKIFNVSLDELVDSDIKNSIVEKVSNTEKLAGIIIKILKFIGIAFVAMLIIDIVSLILFASSGKLIQLESSAGMVCKIGDKSYQIEFGTDGSFACDNCSLNMSKEIKELVDFDDMSESTSNILEYFNLNGGSCE